MKSIKKKNQYGYGTRVGGAPIPQWKKDLIARRKSKESSSSKGSTSSKVLPKKTSKTWSSSKESIKTTKKSKADAEVSQKQKVMLEKEKNKTKKKCYGFGCETTNTSTTKSVTKVAPKKTTSKWSSSSKESIKTTSGTWPPKKSKADAEVSQKQKVISEQEKKKAKKTSVEDASLPKWKRDLLARKNKEASKGSTPNKFSPKKTTSKWSSSSKESIKTTSGTWPPKKSKADEEVIQKQKIISEKEKNKTKSTYSSTTKSTSNKSKSDSSTTKQSSVGDASLPKWKRDLLARKNKEPSDTKGSSSNKEPVKTTSKTWGTKSNSDEQRNQNKKKSSNNSTTSSSRENTSESNRENTSESSRENTSESSRENTSESRRGNYKEKIEVPPPEDPSIVITFEGNFNNSNTTKFKEKIKKIIEERSKGKISSKSIKDIIIEQHGGSGMRIKTVFDRNLKSSNIKNISNSININPVSFTNKSGKSINSNSIFSDTRGTKRFNVKAIFDPRVNHENITNLSQSIEDIPVKVLNKKSIYSDSETGENSVQLETKKKIEKLINMLQRFTETGFKIKTKPKLKKYQPFKEVKPNKKIYSKINQACGWLDVGTKGNKTWARCKSEPNKLLVCLNNKNENLEDLKYEPTKNPARGTCKQIQPFELFNQIPYWIRGNKYL